MQVTTTEVMEAAREFGEAFADCEECRAVRKAQEAFRNNEAARNVLSDFNSLQRSMRMNQMWGGPPSKDELDKLKSLEARVNSNQLIKNLFDAQKRLSTMLANLNAEISNLLGIDFASNSSVGGCC